jgi:hypothetical protein
VLNRRESQLAAPSTSRFRIAAAHIARWLERLAAEAAKREPSGTVDGRARWRSPHEAMTAIEIAA